MRNGMFNSGGAKTDHAEHGHAAEVAAELDHGLGLAAEATTNPVAAAERAAGGVFRSVRRSLKRRADVPPAPRTPGRRSQRILDMETE